MDTALPALFQLPPASPAAARILSHLSKHDKQQFTLACKHCSLLGVAAVTSLRLGHKWYKGKGAPSSSKHCSRTTFPHCTSVALQPRTMDELSKLMSELLLHQVKRLPALTELRLELQGVYDKHCDLSLIIKSIPLHTAQLTSLFIEQGAMMTARAMAAMAEMPLLTSLTIKNAHGYEPGALSKLANVTNLAALHLEVTDSSGSSPPSPAVPSSSSSMTPSELARLQASDEVGLAKCTRLVALTAINLSRSGSLRPIEALLEAIAGGLRPRLARLVLGNMPDLPANALDVLSGIVSLSGVSLAGCDVAGTADLAKLSALTGLTELIVAPQQPPAPVLAALAKGCKRLAKLAMGAPLVHPAAACMPSITELQLLAVSPHGAAAGGGGPGPSSGGGSSSGSVASSFGSMSLRVRPPVQLSGLGKVWPGLRSLEVSGWALDTSGVAAIQQLEGLTSLKLVAGSEQGTLLHAKLLLPLLEMPALQRLVLLELTDLTDEWLGEAVRNVAAANGNGSFNAVKELHMGAAAPPPATAAAAGSSLAAVAGGAAAAAAAGAGGAAAGAAAVAVSLNGGQMLTDRGLVRLFACPCLQKLVLVQLPGITLAGVKALVRGSSTLAAIDLVRCPAISAATRDMIARAAVAAPDRAVDLCVDTE